MEWRAHMLWIGLALVAIAACGGREGGATANDPDTLVSTSTPDAAPTPLDSTNPINIPDIADATARELQDAEADGRGTPPDAIERDTRLTPPPSDASDATGGADADADGAPDVVEPDPPFDYTLCDAGDEAWVKNAVHFLLGRRPAGIREVKVLVDMVAATDRATVARALMRDPRYEDRWATWLMDEVRVNRIGDKKHDNCYGAPLSPDDTGEIATHIRDNGPLDPQSNLVMNMSDVLRSSLKLDDLSPFYRAHLFAMMVKPITGANVAAIEMDITRRQDFGEITSAVYTHRNVVCAGCHNSKTSVTDSLDPQLDLHWPVPGLFEKALYGMSYGRDEMEVYSAFRHLNVVTSNSSGLTPWNIDDACGRFTAAEDVPTDPVEIDAYFVDALGTTASIWHVESALHKGVDMLRDGGLEVDPDTQAVHPHEGFAYLLCSRIANQLWQEAHGYPLTLVHYFPRNESQRNALMALTEHFVADGFSLKTLLVDVLIHPLANQAAPASGCGPGHPYILPAVFNPWVLDELEPELKLNSTGDVLHRVGARVMLSTLAWAMNWPEVPKYPKNEEEVFQKAIGVFVKDAEPGFRGVDFQGMLSWENRYCTCENPSTDGVADWLDLLSVTVAAFDEEHPDTPTALRDGVAALKDRLIAEPDIDETAEAGLIAALFGVENLDVPIAEIPEWEEQLRLLCGALLESPQWLFAGVAAPDQGSEPTLVVNDATYAAHCAELAENLFPSEEWTVTCGENSVDIAAAASTP